MDTIIKISNVKQNNPYQGAYKKIFAILEEDMIFCDRYETEDSKGYVDGDYFLTIEGSIDAREEELISQIKNVEILN